ncbi:GPW/gp25 family protein [Rhodobacter capsulatus]|uniref:GPW/gp25 family protein n=1 Tax=Rhodobacter capsulatus TaxID=1061 RepID=UPI004028577A
MIGMDRQTGRKISGSDHIRQSVADLLSTRVGTRVMRRDYGSEAVDLIDQPGNGEAVLRRYVAIAEALDRFEPRVTLRGFTLTSMAADGGAVIGVNLAEVATGREYSVEVTA